MNFTVPLNIYALLLLFVPGGSGGGGGISTALLEFSLIARASRSF